MKKILLILVAFSLFSFSANSQEQEKKEKSEFWKKVQFGGGINIGFANNATVLGLSPSAIYNITDKFSTGVGVSYLYSKYKNSSNAVNAYGGSLISLYKPMQGLQLSAEYEQTKVTYGNLSRDVPALFLGAGYNLGRNLAAGLRYDVLYDEHKSLYASALTPFVRVYF